MEPRTLLEWAGAVSAPGALRESAVILIDHQEEYRGGKLRLAGIDAAVEECGLLLERARTAGTPVIHVVQDAPADGPLFALGSPMAAIIAELAPRQGETIVHKTRPSSFYKTALQAELEALNRGSLIFAGFMTHMCVSTTVRAALDYGYRSTVVAAATATRDLPDPLGGVVPASVLQQANLAALADRFAVIAPGAAALV